MLSHCHAHLLKVLKTILLFLNDPLWNVFYSEYFHKMFPSPILVRIHPVDLDSLSLIPGRSSQAISSKLHLLLFRVWEGLKDVLYLCKLLLGSLVLFCLNEKGGRLEHHNCYNTTSSLHNVPWSVICCRISTILPNAGPTIIPAESSCSLSCCSPTL
jgi:hypothetical protein